jgi:peptidoglycan/LPS O-acetylase OafA/YrhL
MSGKRVIALDGLRGFAALAVAIPHFFMTLDPAARTPELISIVGVELFFILSGFVLAPQIIGFLESNSLPRFWIFVRRRWYRTLPPYFLALTISAIIAHKLFSPAYFLHLLFLQNLATIDLKNDFFTIAWSLSVEEWFYIVFPLFMYGAQRWFGLGIARSLLIFFGAFFVIRIAGYFLDPDWQALSRRLVIFRLDSIAFGFALYVWMDRPNQKQRRFKMAVPFVIASGAFIALLFSWVGRGAGIPEFLFFYATPFFAGSTLVAFYSAEGLFRDRATRAVATFFGDISYEVYLLHLAVNAAIVRVMPSMSTTAKFSVYILALIIVSATVRHFFELPFLDLRPRYPEDRRPSASPTLSRRAVSWRTTAIVVVAFELFSYTAVHVGLERFKPNAFAHDYIDIASEIPQDYINGWVDAIFAPDIGWSYKPSITVTSKNSIGKDWSETTDANDSMVAPDATGPRKILTLYGDSYSEGAEVNSQQAWHNYLSVLTGLTIENYSTGAYGTDQVIFRLEHDLQNGYRAKVIMIVVHAENIKNIMSSYRGFYSHGDAHKVGFKPVYEQEPKGWHWVLPGLYRPKEKSAIREALERAEQHDHFYTINTLKPIDAFPYSLQLAKYWLYALRTAGMGETWLADHGGDVDEFWRYPPAEQRMLALLDHFVALGKQYDFEPVIVFIPEGQEVQRRMMNAGGPSYATVRAELSRHGIRTIDILEQLMDYSKFNLLPFGSHPSPYGNRVIATAIFNHIRDMAQIAPYAKAPGGTFVEPGVDSALETKTQ